MASTEIVIDKLTSRDRREVARIYTEAISRSYIAYEEVTIGLATPLAFSKKAAKSFEQKLSKSIRSKTEQVYIARLETVPVGFIFLHIKKAPSGHRECWILDLGVAKRHRRHGIAGALMRTAYAFGKKNRAAYFFLESGASNVGAHEFFEKEKFVPLSTIFMKESR
jgi:GNAT superfamily N-acetyltransferase